MTKLICLLSVLVGLLVGAGTVVAQDAAEELYQRGRAQLFNAKDRFAYPQAIETLTAAVAAEPANAAAQLMLANGHSKLGKWAAAATALAAAESNQAALGEADRRWLLALTGKINDRYLDELVGWTAVLAHDPTDRWAWYELANAHLAAENFTAAADAARRALALQPDPAAWEASWLFYTLSKALYRGGQATDAVAAAELGRANATTWRSTYYRQVIAQAGAGDPAAVAGLVDAYIAVSSAEGRNSESYTLANVALLYFEIGAHAEAADYARRSLALEDTPYQRWALAYALSESGAAAEALAVLEAGLAKAPDNRELLAAHGWALYRLGRLEDGLASLERARALSPRRSVAIERLIRQVEAARADPTAPPAPPIPWLG